MRFEHVRDVRIEVRDPRRVGVDKGWIDGRKTVFSKYRAGGILLVQLGNGDTVAPAIDVDMPRKGFMDRLYYEKRRQPPQLGIGGDSTVIRVPVHANIKRYVLLVKSFSEDTGWRYFELDAQALPKATDESIVIPDLLALQPLDERQDAKDLWALHELARSKYKEYEAKEDAN